MMRIAILFLLLVIAGGAGWWFLERHKLVDPPVTMASERRLLIGNGKLESVGFSPDGKVLAVIGEEKDLYLLDTASWAAIQKISDACCTMASVSFSPDGATLAIGMNDPVGAHIRILDSQNGKFETVVRDFRHEGGLLRSVAFSHDGKLLLTEIDFESVLWNVDSGTEDQRFEAGVNGICALSSDRSTLITAESNANEVKLWDVAASTLKFTLTGHTEGLLSVGISPDGGSAASGGYDSTVRIWNVRTGDSKLVLRHGETDAVFALAFSHSGSALATAGDQVRVWNTLTGSQERLIPRGKIDSLAYSPDDRLLAGASRDGKLYIWRLP